MRARVRLTALLGVAAAAMVAASPAAATVSFRLEGAKAVHPVAPDFLGLALEYRSVPAFTGTAAQPVNPLLVQLVRNLAPSGRPLLRIGGQSGDRTWWPVHGMRRPLGITYDLTPAWAKDAGALARTLDARLILGVGLEADLPQIDRVEVHELLSRIGRRYVDALELGNEPELYTAIPWYRRIGGRPAPWYEKSGTPVYGRDRSSWSPGAFVADYRRTLPALGGLPLAGPSSGNLSLLGDFSGAFLSPRSQLRTLTWHAYGLDNCITDPANPQYPSVPHLLSTAATNGFATGIGPYIGLAHRDGASFLLDEAGSVSCNGHPGVSDTFASALWALQTLFTAAGDGIDSVELHTYPGLPNDLFDFSHSSSGAWGAAVRPLYYGALMFTQAAPAGARLLRVSSSAPGQIRAWATRALDGSTRILIVDDSLRQGATVAVTAPGLSAAGALVRLRAPSAYARGGVTLGGRSFGSRTSTGTLAPAQSTAIAPSGDRYTVAMPAASAALLTVPAGG